MPNTSEPNDSAFREMVKSLPMEIQLDVERLLRKLKIMNDDDHLLQLMTVLGLFAAYYQKIPERALEAVKQHEKQTQVAARSVDERVQILQGLTQLIQQATERLSNAGNEIVKRFPVEQIAQSVGQRVDERLESLPLTSFERQVAAAQTTMTKLADTAAASANAINESTSRINKCAQELKDTDLSFMSFWSNAAFTLGGALITYVVIWLGVVRPLQDNEPDMKKVGDLLRNEAYIGYFAVAGYTNDAPVIMVPPNKLKSYNVDGNGNLLVHLNKPAP